MTRPQRVQMTRRRPWRTEHPDAVIVARPSKWGNPFRVFQIECCGHWDVIDENRMTYLIDHAVAHTLPVPAWAKTDASMVAVDLFRSMYFSWAERDPAEVRAELAGRDLACWCPLDQPCHADVLLDLANGAAR